MILSISGEIGEDSLKELVDGVNSLPDGDNLDFYLCSGGGEFPTMLTMLDILQSNKEKITLIGHSELASAAFSLFFLAECPKRLILGTIGMMHLAVTPIMVTEKGRMANVGKVQVKYMASFIRGMKETLCVKLKMTSKEIKEINRHEGEMWFSPERMQEFYEICAEPVKQDQVSEI